MSLEAVVIAVLSVLGGGAGGTISWKVLGRDLRIAGQIEKAIEDHEHKSLPHRNAGPEEQK